MGYQLVASRILSPYFGTTIIVWASLISTFLAAFTAGSFVGGWLSGLSAARRKLGAAVAGGVAVAGLLAVLFFRKPFLSHLEASFESVVPALLIGCTVLFAPFVVALSSMMPVTIELVARAGLPSGKAAGWLYGISTLGNIVGVFLTALTLIPRFPLPQILIGWTVGTAICFTGLTIILSRLSRCEPS